jgi:hypothetical protein
MHLGLSMTLAGSSMGSGIPALPAGATARWNVLASTGADGDLLSSVSDLIGSNTATAAGSARPTLKTGANGLNGLPVMRFNGVANVLALTTAVLPQNFTFVAVSKRIGTYSITFGGTDFYPALIHGATSIEIGNNRCFGGVGGYANTSPSGLGTTWQIVAAAWSGAAPQSPLYANGNSSNLGAVTAYGNSTGLSRIGKTASVFGSCDIADMVMWQRALTSQELQDASAHLNSIWGGVY